MSHLTESVERSEQQRRGGKLTVPLLILLAVCLFDHPASAEYGGGTGEPNDPFLIYTAKQMNAIGAEWRDWDKHFRLMSDIDMSSLEAAPHNIIGNSSGKPFRGVFDGDGHAIHNFKLTVSGSEGVGLFGFVRGQDAQVRNLRLVDPVIHAGTEDRVGALIGSIQSGTVTACSVENGTVSGNERVGGMVGSNSGDSITECFATATVSGTVTVGGLVGESYRRVTNCYSSGSVSGDEKVGGLVGRANPDSITNCYSTARVSGTTLVGGLVGNPNTAKWSFWDIEASGQTESGGGTGMTTAEMQTASTFIGYWGDDPVWTIKEGVDYPRLAWQNMPGEPIVKPPYVDGSGTEADPYLIYTAEQLNTIGLFPCDWDKHFKLMADIDLSEYAGTEFNTIGYKIDASSRNNEPFRGVFDGNGRAISNFNYSSAEEQSCVGIFGYIDRATVENLYLIDPSINVERGAYIGSLVGWSQYATISACYVQGGAVIGGTEVGGLAGNNHGTITECASFTTVSGSSRIGGLAGYNEYGVIGNCYSLSSVSGIDRVGGLVGICGSQATIVHSYSAGRIQGNDSVGGLVGSGDQGDVSHCFWDIETSGQITSAGGTGITTAEMWTAGTFVGWGPYAVWTISEGLDYPRLLWENMAGEMLTTPSFPSVQGSGTQDDPYLIYTAAQFNEIGLFPLEWDKHFKLMADIDLTGYTGTMFNVIGRYVRYPSSGYESFSGIFDGNGHIVSNFDYSGVTTRVGIFGTVEGGEIEDLHLVDPNIGSQGQGANVGSLVGWIQDGTVSNCSVDGGNVLGGSGVGGLIGRSYRSFVRDCTISGFVSGGSMVGGLVGIHSGTITNCHFSGEVSATGPQVGGLAGQNYDTIADCSVAAVVSGAKQVGGLIGAQRDGRITGCHAAGSVTWTIEEGSDYPRLAWEKIPGEPIVKSFYGGGSGILTDPYLIDTAEQLNMIGLFPCDWDKHFKLMADVDLSAYAGMDFNIIGYYAGLHSYNNTPFTGVFDGNGKTISNFTYVSTDKDLVGLFMYVDDPNAQIKDLGLIDPNINAGQGRRVGALVGSVDSGSIISCWIDGGYVCGGFSTGGLAGDSSGEIHNCSFVGTVTGDSRVGGLVGSVFGDGRISDCDTAVTVSGSSTVGGLVGENLGLELTNCRTGGSIVGDGRVGGLVGGNYRGEISNCNSAASVQGGGYAGGLVGNNAGPILKSSANGPVVGDGNVGGLVGVNSDSISDCYSTGSVLGAGNYVGGLVGQSWPDGAAITGSHATGNVVGTDYVGGLVGYDTSTISECSSTGEVSGVDEVGGLLGRHSGGPVAECYSSSIVGGHDVVGGLVGRNNSTIADCYSTGPVSGNDIVGGLVGFNHISSLAPISYDHREITNCYSAGNVTGNERTGGLVGYKNGSRTGVAGSFWDMETSGQVNSDGGAGTTTATMQMERIFVLRGWDFIDETANGTEDIWWILEGQDYPRLSWEPFN